MKIALFTPWPPQRSGIADYAYRLADGLLAQGVELSVVTAAAAPTPLHGCAIHVCTPGGDADVPVDSLPVFQLGNNVAFHGFQPAFLSKLGGLVHLHDPVLHHFHVDRILASGDGGYWDDLYYWYGPAVADACRRMVELGAPPWANAAVTAIPFFEPYLQFADAVLVHSSSALQTIHERMPALRTYRLPQCYPIPAAPPRLQAPAERALRLGVFGWIEPHKRVDQILAAIVLLHNRGIEITLDVCGPTGSTMGALADRIRALGLRRAVRLRGHLDGAEFLSEIASVDVCVNLRDPTMGETSAIVVQALQLGTPVIVSDVGWYAELPECVLKVPAGPRAADALAAQLTRLHGDRHELWALAEATRRYAAIELDFGVVTARYAQILADLSSERERMRSMDRELYQDVARALADLELSTSGREAAITAEIVAMLATCL